MAMRSMGLGLEVGLEVGNVMAKSSLSQLAPEGHHILYDAACLNQPSPSHFSPAWWQSQGQLSGRAEGRGEAHFLDGEPSWVLRHYRRGGLVARWVEDRYIYLGLEKTRPFREARLLSRLYNQGLPVPRPVAARVSRQGLSYRGDLITERVPGQPLADVLLAGEADIGLFQRLGEQIRQFHDQGVFHADLNVRNILVDQDSIHLIDFDQGGIRRAGNWQRQNLERLQRSLRKILGSRWSDEPQWGQAWLALEQAYEVGTTQ